MHLFFAILLCLAIPLQGWAAGAVSQMPCPMGDMTAMQAQLQANSANEAVTDLTDCCNDAVTSALTGKLCKTGQECQVPTGWLGPLSQTVIKTQSASDIPVTAPPLPQRGAPESVWRPPII